MVKCTYQFRKNIYTSRYWNMLLNTATQKELHQCPSIEGRLEMEIVKFLVFVASLLYRANYIQLHGSPAQL